MSDFIYREEVKPIKSLNLSGAPADYWQVYNSTSQPPFAFPIPSKWITKSVSPPNPLLIDMLYSLLRCFVFLIACFWFSSVPVLPWLLLFFLAVSLRSLLLLLLFYFSLSLSDFPSFFRPFLYLFYLFPVRAR